MLSWAITFFVVAIIAGILGLSGVAGAATQIAYILFVVVSDRCRRQSCRRATTAGGLTPSLF